MAAAAAAADGAATSPEATETRYLALMATAFVTGGTGFVGLNVIDQLLLGGHRVVALHRPTSDVRRLKERKVELAVGAITDRASLDKAIPDACDFVFHIAGNTSTWSGDRDVQTRDNVDGTRNVVDAALAKKVKRMVHTSSVAAYGAHENAPIDESAPQRGKESPVNYERTKCLAEEEVRAGIARGLDAVILNPGHVIGRFDAHNWARSFLMVHKGRLPGIPPGVGSFADGDEVAKAHVTALTKGRTGENYFLGGIDATYVEMFAIIGRLLGKKVPTKAAPLWLLSVAASVMQFGSTFTGRAPDFTPELVYLLKHPLTIKNDKAVRELDYKIVPLETMLTKCHEWLRAEGLLG